MKLGLSLSGGGIRGIAHAGVIKALEENNIKIDMISGTSCGSYIAVLYAMGFSPYYIYNLFDLHAKDILSITSKPLFSGLSILNSKKEKIKGINTGESIEKVFDEIASRKGIKYIKDIKMPIAIPSVDISNSKEYFFTNCTLKNTENTIGNITIGKAVRASSSFPILFSPLNYENHKFLDGGILNNVPVKIVKDMGADKVIAINFSSDVVDEDSNVMDISMKTLDIMGNKISEENLEKADYILTVPSDKTGLLDIKKLGKCYNFGYEAVYNNINNIKKITEE